MATRGEIRQRVRFALGERVPGTFQDDELNYYIWESANEHAKKAYSVRAINWTSTVHNVQDYACPPNFYAMLAVRYRNEQVDDSWELEYTSKDVVRDAQLGLGDPYYYYREQNSFGISPIPDKPFVVDYSFENACPGFTDIFNRETSTGFSQQMGLDVIAAEMGEPLEMEVPDTDLDPRCVWVANVGLYLKRTGTYFPGKVWLSFTNITPGREQFVHTSGELAVNSIDSQPKWVLFDFTHNPIEIDTTHQTYQMQLHVDTDYQNASPQQYGGSGIQVGTEVLHDTPQAFLQMHRLRNDLAVEHYKGSCDLMETDDAVCDVPDIYTETLVHQVLEKCYLKVQNLQLSAYWGTKAAVAIREAKADAVIPTIGRKRNLRRSPGRFSNLTYSNTTGLFTLRFGRP